MPNSIFDDIRDETPEKPVENAHVPELFSPVSAEESRRRDGVAWSAGIAFFSSVVFMLFLGWLGDIVLGTSPWGVVGGIIIGSAIGFFQFFRITSRIFGREPRGSEITPLLSSRDDKEPPAPPL